MTMKFDPNDTARWWSSIRKMTFLSEQGVSWALVGESVKDNKTVANLIGYSKLPRSTSFKFTFLLTTCTPADQAWQFGGAVEMMMLDGKEFFRPGPLQLDGFTASGPIGWNNTNHI